MWKSTVAAVALVGALAINVALAGDTPAPKDAEVYIIWPPDGKVIRQAKLWVRFGLKNAGVAPAEVEKQFTGHHHLLVDTDLPPFNEEIPSDRNHIHFGSGQTEGRLEDLSPGKHTLQLLFADHNHVPHNPPLYSKKITIIVPENPAQ